MNTEDSEFARIEREIKTRVLPDLIHHADIRESLEYITGWNDCRQAMLAEQPEHQDIIGEAQNKLIAEQAAQSAPAAQQEPYGWHTEDHLTDRSATTYSKDVADRWKLKGWPVTPFYTTPQAQRKPLTDEQIHEMANDFEEGYVFLYRRFARAIEAAHGIEGKHF